jgi:hypothetical protein
MGQFEYQERDFKQGFIEDFGSKDIRTTRSNALKKKDRSEVFPTLYCTNFRVCGLILRSMIHFELLLVINMDLVSVFCRLLTSFPSSCY